MYYLIILALLFAVSKELYVVNEESLVALSFVLFLVLSYKMIASMISSELDSRTDQLRKEFQFGVSARENSLKVLLGYHQTQLALLQEIVSVIELLQQKVTETIQSKEEKLGHWMRSQQRAKLASLLQQERALLSEWSEQTVAAFSAKVVEQTSRDAPLRVALLKESITALNHL